MSLYYINLSYACYGVVTNHRDIIVEAPPIARWAKGKHIAQFVLFIARKRGEITKIQ